MKGPRRGAAPGARAWTGWALVAAAAFTPGCASGAGGTGASWAGSEPAALEAAWKAPEPASAPPMGFWKKLWHPYSKAGREEAAEKARREKLERDSRPKEPVTFWDILAGGFAVALRIAMAGGGG